MAKKEEPKKTSKETKKKVTKFNQPEINIGLIGHVDHGKTTLTERFSGKWADTHSEEIKRGITIRLGYADAEFSICEKCKLYVVGEKCPKCEGKTKFLRKVSFVDAPGHESLMATMLAGATMMDGAILLVSAAEECPQPQTREHLMALEIMGVKNVIVVQNKVDIVKEDQALKNYEQIKTFLSKTKFKDAPIIPISAQHNINIDLLIQAIEEHIKTPKRDNSKSPLMFVARSFDINKPGQPPKKLVGGILGGALTQGKLKVGDTIEIKPGREVEKDGRKNYIPIQTEITGLKSGGDNTDELSPGGSIGVLTLLDPGIVKSDKLAGSVVGLSGKLPPVLRSLKLETHLLDRVVGSKEDIDVDPIKLKEPLMLNVNSAATVGVVTEIGKDEFDCILKLPVCADIGARVTISRRVGARFRLIGFGIIKE
ncbi:translation initiation factor IF-2 subunit gamma [Candidatus Woesearchaeota archaeon]|jgi:translation initiation factor 2 subunit 3|nr:translation initiation factor IF-2 subunit gamma [Candidatus Woesearchaeota archaeon]MBT6519336.1 translation initiation factor IF-2 subunit gamma [Candidatus Woesearchaeota archaeon]MBT7366796.1 translation initiation factor IF-2 subunit gamma [Candidatus Woesearchaeota archaeon]